ncbi:MAG: hypothetical protein VKL59_01035 [Nostocaceae cyanobacterium]|nr:hypothetical protein [Nostocaceae cyanobacterium]
MQNIKKDYGVAVKHAKRMGEMLRQAMQNAAKNSSVNWASLSMEIDRQVRQSEVKHYVKELLRRAGKGLLHEFRYNQRVDTSNLPVAIVERLFQEAYKSNFEQRIPLASNHHAGVDSVTVTERVEAIRPDMFAEISKWAKKATTDEDVKNLRRSSREKVKEIDLKEFPVLDDIVDRTAVAENLLPKDMQSHLLQLYQTYVSEWDAVQSQIAVGILNKRSDQQVSDRCWVVAQQG